ncbi:HipA family kinase [Flavobacterium subsaxonicum]|uniref:Aminotransferase class I and II n=1 Tax=Flavobacterium subsaxonicum WB 4.1-42 = DSM 21790 TaxID=1121898 RepID=A0A0A2MTS8_9FLAO|nr:HipA family kinase [Flavobacterium subsaxonicum]KGO95016.1 aminotransferase class I and II [Flavobacterium subsaxonicum WB 4.1-42 = DSM 21790]
MSKPYLRTVNVTRYITPLREGGSLPALAEADDNFNYVLKFKGAGHGTKALIAELLGGEIARALGLPVPELVFANLDEAFGRTEADEEIQDLLQNSQGLNLALHFLSEAINFDPVVTTVDAKLASQIVWLDAFITNVDRTFRNTNMLLWHKELWLIDHGAALYFHHAFSDPEGHAKVPFTLIKDHVLLPQATLLEEVDAEYKAILTEEKIREIVSLLPNEWLVFEGFDESPDSPQAIKEIYVQFFLIRLQNSAIFIKQAQDARQALI